MTALKAIAFDFDGVLAESVNVKTEAFRILFQQETPAHLQTIVDYHLQNGGLPRFDKFRTIYKDILNRDLPEVEFQRLCSRFSELVMDAVVSAPWVSGAEEFLRQHQGAFQFFIVSATPDAEMKEIVRRKHIESYFTDVLGSPRKKSLLLQDLLTRYNLKTTELVYVGDAGNDWDAAQQLGIPFIWRRSSPELSLPGYEGPCLPTLQNLEQALSAYSPEGLARTDR